MYGRINGQNSTVFGSGNQMLTSALGQNSTVFGSGNQILTSALGNYSICAGRNNIITSTSQNVPVTFYCDGFHCQGHWRCWMCKGVRIEPVSKRDLINKAMKVHQRNLYRYLIESGLEKTLGTGIPLQKIANFLDLL